MEGAEFRSDNLRTVDDVVETGPHIRAGAKPFKDAAIGPKNAILFVEKDGAVRHTVEQTVAGDRFRRWDFFGNLRVLHDRRNFTGGNQGLGVARTGSDDKLERVTQALR